MEFFSETSPFYGLKISSLDPLRSIKDRHVCEGCKRSVRYFCYRCLKLASELEGQIPQLKLPIKDKRELDGKTTSVHAQFLAPNETKILEYDKYQGSNGGLESVLETENSVILFPSADSKAVSEVDWSSIKRIVVLDGTWSQAKGMSTSPLLKSIPKIHLNQSNQTRFWRYQNVGPHCLATIEAIHEFYKELEAQINPESDQHKYDDLLYFFAFLYNRVQEEYRHNKEKQFTSRHGKAKDYIKYDD